MNAQMRHARFDLKVGIISVGLMLLAYALLRAFTNPTASQAAFAFFSILGLWGLDGRFYRKKPGGPTVVMDERDKQIRDRARLQAWGIVWLYWGLLCMVPWFVVSLGQGIDAVQTPSVPVLWLPYAYGGGFAVHGIAWASSVLLQYRRGGVESE